MLFFSRVDIQHRSPEKPESHFLRSTKIYTNFRRLQQYKTSTTTDLPRSTTPRTDRWAQGWLTQPSRQRASTHMGRTCAALSRLGARSARGAGLERRAHGEEDQAVSLTGEGRWWDAAATGCSMGTVDAR